MLLMSRLHGRLSAGFRRTALIVIVLGLVPAIGFGQAPEPKTGSIAGVVTDAETGAPVPDVEVRVFPRIEGASRPVQGKIRIARTDARGSYRVENVAPGDYGIQAVHGTKASHRRHLDYAKALVTREGSSATVDLKLAEARSLKVLVLAEETRKPVPEALVQLRWSDREDHSRTDEQGVAVVVGVPQQELKIEVKAPDFQLAEITQAPTGSLTEIKVNLRPGGSIQGKVVDDKGQPLPGVGVYAGVLYSPVRYDSAVSDKDGKFLLNSVPRDQRMQVVAVAPGFVETIESVSLNGARQRSIEMSMKPRVRGGDVEVTVVDADGRPISGAEIVNVGARGVQNREARTNAEGRAFLKDLNRPPQFEQPEITIRAERFAPSVVKVTRAEEGPAKVRVTLEKGHSFRARIVNEAGEPIPQATAFTSEGNRGGKFGLGTTHVVDDKGRLSATTLIPESLLTIEAPGYTPIHQMKLELDQDVEQVITLDRTGHFRVVVVDGNTKQPIRKFHARLNFASTPPPDGVFRGRSLSAEQTRGKSFEDAEGRLFWDNLANNTAYDILIDADGYEPLRRASAVTSRNETDLRIELQPVDPASQVEVAGRILDPKGDPIEGVDVHLIGVDPRLAAQQRSPSDIAIYSIRIGSAKDIPLCKFAHGRVTAADGSFKFPSVSKHLKLQLVYWGQDVPAMRVRDLEEQPAAELGRLEIIAPRAVTVKGTIDLAKFPNPGRISTQTGSLVDSQSTEIDPKDRSRYSITNLPPGEFKVILYGEQTRRREKGTTSISGGATLDTKTVTARSGETIEVNFD